MSKFTSLESEGFDVASALKQLAGSEKLYLNVLTKFSAMYGTIHETMQADLGEGNLEKLHRDAHTIKGLAGTMGHEGLRAAAARLEHSAVPERAAECAAALAEFRLLFPRVIAALNTVLNP